MCCMHHNYLACPMLMGIQRRKLNWTEPPEENGLTIVFSTRPLRNSMWMQKGNEEKERAPWCLWSSLPKTLVEGLKADHRAGWRLHLMILTVGGKPRLDPKIKLYVYNTRYHLNSLPCLCNRSGAGTSTVSSLGGEIINGAGALSITHANTYVNEKKGLTRFAKGSHRLSGMLSLY